MILILLLIIITPHHSIKLIPTVITVPIPAMIIHISFILLLQKLALMTLCKHPHQLINMFFTRHLRFILAHQHNQHRPLHPEILIANLNRPAFMAEILHIDTAIILHLQLLQILSTLSKQRLGAMCRHLPLQRIRALLKQPLNASYLLLCVLHRIPRALQMHRAHSRLNMRAFVPIDPDLAACHIHQLLDSLPSAADQHSADLGRYAHILRDLLPFRTVFLFVVVVEIAAALRVWVALMLQHQAAVLFHEIDL
mmetsp:Transcript_29228/g.46349  ORF Transcript_29228/g.46349 Transcript_29228/m.46349 type:complete len:253 (-) Transcript_29228:508-1266(-)